MHELSITHNIVTIVGEAAKGRRVKRITLEVGKLSGVMSDAIAFCFDAITKGTALDGTVLHITEIDAAAQCRTCGTEFIASTLFTPCPCGSRDITRLRGEELKITTMELEEAA